jgi:hypothetical protein
MEPGAAIWAEAGELAQMAEDAWIRLIAGEDEVFADGLRRKLAALRAELAGGEPSPLVRLLVDRVAVCWLQVQYADLCYAQNTEVSLAQARFMVHRQQTAQARYLDAVKGLAAVRGMPPANRPILPSP